MLSVAQMLARLVDSSHNLSQVACLVCSRGTGAEVAFLGGLGAPDQARCLVGFALAFKPFANTQLLLDDVLGPLGFGGIAHLGASGKGPG